MNRQNRDRQNILPAILILILILVFTSILLREGRLRDRDVARLGSLEAANGLAEAFSIGRDWQPAEKAVIGWGLYGPDGSPVRIAGTAPERLPSSPAGIAAEEFSEGRLRTVRTMMAARPGETTAPRGGGMAGGGMRRLVLIDWDMKADGNPELKRIAGAAGLVLLAIATLVMQQRSAYRLAIYRRDEERRRRLEQLGMASRTLAHEIRNPLGSIKAQTALLRRIQGDGDAAAGLPEEARRTMAADGLAAIEAETDRISELTDRVREWLSDPRGKPTALSVGLRLNETLDAMEWPTRRNIPIPGPTVRMDGALFDAVIGNLVRNAVESMEDDTDASPPVVTLTVGGGRAVIKVEDRGRGLRLGPGGTEELFQPFHTTKIRGSGVGLALARQAVEAAGGSLVLENRDGGGTRARVELPVEKS